ncbi:MAG: TPM domain-containing protein, partial [Bacteroidota bacterium]
MRKWTQVLLIGFLALFIASCSTEEVCYPEAKDGVFVYDLEDMFSPKEEQTIQRVLQANFSASGNPMVVITHPTFCGEEPFRYGTHALTSMGVGTDSLDNGLVMIISKQRRETFITPGDGLEGAIPDAYAKRVIENTMIP